jgi:hypothetical protein
MKNQIMRMGVLRNLALSTFTLLALTGAAHAQGENVNTMTEKQDAEERRAAKAYMDKLELDQKYKATLQNQQAPATSNDPWGNVRPTTTPAKPAVKPAAGAAKPTGGASKSATGSGKPAIGAAASANGVPAKGQ